MRRTIRLCVTGALAASVVVALPAGADSHLEPVMTGIDNPRGLGFDDAGNLYVASAGTGGPGPCIDAPEGEGSTCYGNSGAIFRLDAADVGGSAEAAPDPDVAFVPSLPSLAPQEGDFARGDAIGPADVSYDGAGSLYFTIGLGADPAVRDGALESADDEDDMASLHRVAATDGSGLTKVADLGDHEATEDPDNAGPDSNPFGVAASAADGTATVLDSGGNTVVEVDIPGPDASPTTGAVLPPTFVPAPPFLGAPSSTNIPAQAVPTGIAAHGDGFVVGQLTGFPFAVGAANVWAYDGDTASPMAQGFTNIMDVATDGDDVYVLELASDGLLNASAENPPMGSLIRVTEGAGGTITRELLLDGVFMPGGLAIHDGWAYMTTGSAFPADVPGAGEVVRFNLSADPLVTVSDDTGTTDEDMRLVAGDVDADQFTSVTDAVTDNDGDEVVSIEALDVARGAAWVDDGNLMYQPALHFSGQDAVPYRACNADGDCVNAVLHVTVRETDTDRIAGEDRMVTAVTASQGDWPDGANVAVIARADLYPDALTGGPLAKAANGPILLTQSDVLTPVVAEELERLAPSMVYILGGEMAINADVEAAIEAIVPDVERLGGVDRFATAVEVMRELDSTGEGELSHAFVVEGVDPDPTRGWPDAVAVSALAAWQGSPILLVATEVVPDTTAAALDGIDATIIGGPVAINPTTRARIADLAEDVDEIAGDNRYHTSQLIAEAGLPLMLRGTQLTLVSGGNWPDALVAGPVAAGNPQGPMMLVHPTDLAGSPETVAFIQDEGPFPNVDLFGGPAAISNTVEAGIAAANQ